MQTSSMSYGTYEHDVSYGVKVDAQTGRRQSLDEPRLMLLINLIEDMIMETCRKYMYERTHVHGIPFDE